MLKKGLGFRVSGFRDTPGADLRSLLQKGFRVSGFQGFRVSGFQGFRVSRVFCLILMDLSGLWGL